MTEDEILPHLDNYKKWGYYCQFIDLGHAYSYLIDCRLNIFRNGEEWAVAAERSNGISNADEPTIAQFATAVQAIDLDIVHRLLTHKSRKTVILERC